MYIIIIFQKASTYISTTVLASFPNANRLLFAYFWFLLLVVLLRHTCHVTFSLVLNMPLRPFF